MTIQNLDALKSLAALMDLITNPAKYQALIDGAKKAAEEHRKAAGQLQTARDVQEYRAQTIAEVQQREDALWQRQQQLEKKAADLDTETEARNTANDLQKKGFAQREWVLQKREDAVKDLEALKVLLQKELQSLEAAKQELYDRQTALKVKEEALKLALR